MASASTAAPAGVPFATLKELMDATVDPAADGLWDAVSASATAAGIEQHQPRTPQEWAAVRRHAITLIEAMNLVVMPGRHAAPVGTQTGLGELRPQEIEARIEQQRAAFVGFANALRVTAREALKAIDRKDPDALLTAGGDIDAACEACHVTFWYPNQPSPDISGTWSRSPDSPSPADGPRASAKCKYEGMPTIMAARGALEILQTPGQVTVLGEYMTQTRRIYLDGSLPPLDDVSPGYMGYSVGQWQGDTLEVQTIGIREDVSYRDVPHSAKLKILEKIHLTAPDRLQDEITLVDPDALAAPYRLTFNYRKDSDHRILEYVCDHNSLVAARDPR